MSNDHIKARVVAASISPQEIPIYTIEATYPRYIHSQVMTHRVFSRSSASSRAIPVETMLNSIEESTWYPEFMLNKKGMSPTEYADNIEECKSTWYEARLVAIESARRLNSLGLHKQIVNRVLEPFTLTTTLITSTEWDNFFSLRCHESTQQELTDLALKIRDAIKEAPLDQVLAGEWHLPFITKEELYELGVSVCKDVSTARCARVSYTKHNSFKDITDDQQLALQLKTEGHLSPFEHIASPIGYTFTNSNFKNWIQYRSEVAHWSKI